MLPTTLDSSGASARSHLLARSAFALVFLAFVGMLVTVPFLLSAPMRANMRTLLLVIYGVGLLGLIGAGILLLRKPIEQWAVSFQPLVSRLSRRGVAIILIFFILEVDLVALFLIRGLTPNLMFVFFLILWWSILLLAALLIIVGDQISAWFSRTRSLWSSIGITLAALFGLLILYLVNGFLLEGTSLIGRLRGTTDYRVLTFFGGEVDAERSREYWAELGGIQAQWLPYTYSRIQPVQGQYINVATNGLRQTASFVDAETDAPDVFFFGGSTVWGDGSRDDYTIPSQVARLLDERGQAARVTNFGQVAYVSTQDLILFQLQLAQGNVPEVAVFYGGFNDLASTYIHQAAGLPHNEVNRIQEFYVGRLLDAGQIILARPRITLDDVDLSLVTSEGTAEETVNRYLENIRIIRALAAEYGVRTLFVWQPTLLFKENRTPEEQQFVDDNEAVWPGFWDLYREADTILRERIDGESDFLILSDLFSDESGYIFIDRVHIIEDGNFRVAQAIEPHVATLLE